MVNLNCTNHSWCQIIKNDNINYEKISHLVILGFSSLGVIFNSISAFILSFSKNSSTKFLQFLNYYSINSLAISLNDALFVAIYLYLDSVHYKYNSQIYFDNEKIVKLFIIYLNIWAFLYTFSGMLDIFIVYERIQIYLTDLKFLRNRSAGIISFGVLLYSLIINIPVGLARTNYKETITIDSKDSVIVYSYGLRKFEYNQIFLFAVFISNFIRDIISFMVEMILNISLIVTMTRYYKRRMTVNIQNLNTFAFKRTDINNNKIALFMNFLSAIFHTVTFALLIILRNHSFYAYIGVSHGFLILYSLRHTLNFFLFLKLNKKFRRNFYVLIPKVTLPKLSFLKLILDLRKLRAVRPQNSHCKKIVTEHVNLQSMTTHL